MKKGAIEYGVEDIKVALSSHKVTPSELGFDLPQNYYQSVSGAQTLTKATPEEDAFVLCSRAAEILLSTQPGLIQQIDAILVVTLPVEPTVAPISARLQGYLGARSNTFCLDLTLSCVGFLQAASLVVKMMPAHGWKKVLLLNVETLTKIIRPEDQALGLIMSDGATASLFSDRPRLVFDQFDFFSDGNLASILGTRNGNMFMDGPRLYETVLRRIPTSFRDSLKKFGLGRDEVDLFIFHQGSRKVLDKLIELLALESSKVPQTIAQFGNLGSCSIPHILSELLENPAPQGRRFFATAFGAGFQWAHASLRQKG